ncbi:hypothetical protein ABPG75_004431 [Micractinium tetrahymenae]
MRRSARAVLGFARQAACSGLVHAEGTVMTATSCSSSAALLPPAAAASGRAAAAAALPAVRCFAATARPQHNAEPAAAEQQQQQQQQRAYERTCWQCGTPLSAHDQFFCPECESVQPASGDPQYYQVFDLGEQRFDVDAPDLEQRYRALQRRLHPDKFSTASPLEQEYAHQQAAVVNQAYDVLKKPLRRAHYILNQAGLGACEGMTITDPELLMYVMEAREDVEGAADKAQLARLLDQNTALKDKCIQELATAFRAGDLLHAAELTTQLRYICRIREAIVEKL